LATLDESPLPPKRLTGDERRQQLVEIATRLFARHGFSGTTTREIARAAGVTEAIIFRYFPRKDDLYAAILDWKSCQESTTRWCDELSALAAAGEDEPIIRAVVRRLIDFQRRDPAFLRLMLHSALEGHGLAEEYRKRHFEPLERFLTDYVAEGQRRGRFVEGDPRALVFSIFALPMHHNLVETLGLHPGRRFNDDVIGFYTAFIVRGLRKASPALPTAAEDSPVRESE
jgi:TetR/AcrR family transcriptional regulator